MLHIAVAYAEPHQQAWLNIEVPEGCTVRNAINASGILEKFPHIDLERQKVGIFGKVTALDAALNEGDRIEIYRAIICDPKKVPRRARDEE
jgi:hypothetical protein